MRKQQAKYRSISNERQKLAPSHVVSYDFILQEDEYGTSGETSLPIIGQRGKAVGLASPPRISNRFKAANSKTLTA